MNDTIKFAAREMRRNMTETEKILWSYIKNWKLWKSFQRQKPIFVYEEHNQWKRYVIVDFICLQEKLIIEIDWSIHKIPEVLELDKHKEELLCSRWYRIIRFTNLQVQTNIKIVLLEIHRHLTYSTSESPPFNKKGGGLKTW